MHQSFFKKVSITSEKMDRGGRIVKQLYLKNCNCWTMSC